MNHYELLEAGRILAEQCKEYSENEWAICPHGTGSSVKVQDVIDFATKQGDDMNTGQFIEEVYELAFGDEAISRGFTRAEVVARLFEMLQEGDA